MHGDPGSRDAKVKATVADDVQAGGETASRPIQQTVLIAGIGAKSAPRTAHDRQ
jgi:hypothetical protein